MKTFETQSCIEKAIGRAFLAAHLFTASAGQAESAVLEALNSWDPDEESAEALVQGAVATAAQAEMKCAVPSPTEQASRGAALPAELRAVLRLPRQLRHCYVLRILIGLSGEFCAGLLHLHPREVEQHTRAALQCLPFVNRSSFGVEHLAWRMDWTG